MEMIMKALFASVAAVAALSAAVPAAAQSWGGQYNRQYDNYGGQYRDDFRGRGADSDRIAQRIDMGVRNGSLTRSEAARLHAQLRQVQQLEWRYGRDGRITPNEARELDNRYARLQVRLRVERHDNDRAYGSGYGRW